MRDRVSYWTLKSTRQELNDAYKQFRKRTWRIAKQKKKHHRQHHEASKYKMQQVYCDKIKNGCIGKDYTTKMNMLKEAATIKFKNDTPYDKRRKKSYFYYEGKGCLICGVPSEVVHHIILIKHGGYDAGFNRVCLCNSCHASIHTWMVDEVIERKEMEMINEIKAFC